jgi:hypothetical protein
VPATCGRGLHLDAQPGSPGGDCGGGVLGGQVGVDRGCRGDARCGRLHDASGYVGGIPGHPHAGGCRAAGGVRRDLVADVEGVLSDGGIEAVQEA